MLDRVVEVEVVWGDGSHDPGETLEADSGFSSTIRDVNANWSPS